MGKKRVKFTPIMADMLIIITRRKREEDNKGKVGKMNWKDDGFDDFFNNFYKRNEKCLHNNFVRKIYKKLKDSSEKLVDVDKKIPSALPL